MASGAIGQSGEVSEPRRETRAAFSSLAIVDYRRLWWAGTFSFMAVQMQFLLRGVLAWDLTEREGALGLVYLCFGVAMLIATPLGGVAADRLPKLISERGQQPVAEGLEGHPRIPLLRQLALEAVTRQQQQPELPRDQREQPQRMLALREQPAQQYAGLP